MILEAQMKCLYVLNEICDGKSNDLCKFSIIVDSKQITAKF